MCIETCRHVWPHGPASPLKSAHMKPPDDHLSNNNNRTERRNSRFVAISSLRHKLSPTRALKWPGHNRVQVTCSTSSAYHVQHVMIHAMWYEGTAIQFDRV